MYAVERPMTNHYIDNDSNLLSRLYRFMRCKSTLNYFGVVPSM